MNILSIGGSGLIGSRIETLLCEKYSFVHLNLKDGVDIRKPQTLTAIGEQLKDSVVFLLAAKTDVDGCEKDKALAEKGDAWKINVAGTQNVVNACQMKGNKIIFVSTDFVFDGKKPKGEFYSEDDVPNPINWYGQTKYNGEEIVRKSGLPYLILRFAFPYRLPFSLKKDFVQAIYERLQKKERVTVVFDQIITPTFVDDIADALDRLISTDQTGTFQIVGSSFLSPYDASKEIARIFSLDSSLIEKISLDDYYNHRAPRPINLGLKNDKITGLGVSMKTFEEGLTILKNQL